ncbi:MAG: DUF4233 domain-containing protein [Actinomycetota bacterium]|nr:MAG: DUF4233 domain-containing protein [Actinomycetota bacterium]
MRVLCSSVLVFEAIVLGLSIPVAITVGGYPATAVAIGGGLLVLLCVVAIGTLPRLPGVVLGWAVQVGAIGSAVLVPAMVILGGIFAALWWCALHYGRRADQIRFATAGLTATTAGPVAAGPASGGPAPGGTAPSGPDAGPGPDPAR